MSFPIFRFFLSVGHQIQKKQNKITNSSLQLVAPKGNFSETVAMTATLEVFYDIFLSSVRNTTTTKTEPNEQNFYRNSVFDFTFK